MARLAHPEPSAELNPAATAAGSRDQEVLKFGLSRALSIHGQKHIWDNISGDVLQVLRHYKVYKAWTLPVTLCGLWRL